MIHAVLLFWVALQGGPADATQHFRQGLDARKEGRLDAAIVEFRKASELDPNLSEAFLNLGETYMEKHDYAAAIAPLKRALELKPDLAPAHRDLGLCLIATGRIAPGWREIETGLRLSFAGEKPRQVLAQMPRETKPR